MPKLYFENENCMAATSAATGNKYYADNKGFISVENKSDIDCLTSGGYRIAGGMPRMRKFWVCDNCAWDAAFNHCSKCGSTSLRKVER